MGNNLPPIQYFFGNTDFNNWIRNCKPFAPIINTNNEVNFIDVMDIHDIESKISDFNMHINYLNSMFLIPKNYLYEN